MRPIFLASASGSAAGISRGSAHVIDELRQAEARGMGQFRRHHRPYIRADLLFQIASLGAMDGWIGVDRAVSN